MDESNDVLALAKITNEVDDAQIKVMLSSQCIKAQAFLVEKLRRQCDRQREVCNFIKNDNLKVEAEIKQAEQDIRSMLIAQDTIKSANVELKKEWLLAKEMKVDITERIEIGVKKYEAQWAQCKEKFETIPFVQKLLKATERVEMLNNDIDSLDKEEQKIYEEIKTRRNTYNNLDKQRVLELADFMINELPNKIKVIKEKSDAINELSTRINDILKEETPCGKVTENKENNLKTNKEVKAIINVDDKAPIGKNDDDSLIPTLKLQDFGAFDIGLDQIKMKNSEILTPIDPNPLVAYETNTNYSKEDKTNDFIISPYFHKPIYEDRAHNYSKSKLINILEDINIDDTEAYKIVSKVNPDKFQVVQEISAEEGSSRIKDKENFESEDIEVIDLTSSNVIVPPTQFLDISLQVIDTKNSQPYGEFLKNIPKQQEPFDLTEDVDKENVDDANDNNSINKNQTITSQLDGSATSEESFMKIKDMILKKHNLDLSPQFVYGRNNILQKNDEEVVQSKFFQHDDKAMVLDITRDDVTDMDVQQHVEEKSEPPNMIEENNLVQSQKTLTETNIPKEVDDVVASSPKEKKGNEAHQQSVAGLLFTHGAQGLPDSLNVSISTTGYEDSDFPHCIDSSLLLSPKADLPMNVDNAEVLSQDVPNFLSGLRKAGLSFFGGGTSTSKPESNVQDPKSSFSFNFGGDNKKNRGGLFNMFQ